MPASIRKALVTAFAAIPMFSTPPGADQDAWIKTGQGIREKSLALVHIQAFTISHWVRVRPTAPSRSIMIDLDSDKKFVLRMLRDVGANRMKEMFRDAFTLNGYRDASLIDAFLAALTRDLVKGDQITIAYTARAQTTLISLQDGGSATLHGRDFMRATWRIWYGKTDQPTLGEALISNLRAGE
jgi:hypothetical protein